MNDADRVSECVALLLVSVERSGMVMTGDQRVSESDAAELIGLHAGTLKNLRSEGAGPVAYRAGLNGSRVSYRLTDLAAWLEGKRD